jgi:hypothetical protein
MNQTPSRPVSAPPPGPTRPGHLKSNLLADWLARTPYQEYLREAMEQPSTESVREQIAELKARQDASTNESEREELGEAIQSIAMGWQLRQPG